MFNREVMFSKAAVELLSSAMSSSYQWSNYYNGKRTIWQQLWEEMMLCAYKCWKSATRNCLEHDSSCSVMHSRRWMLNMNCAQMPTTAEQDPAECRSFGVEFQWGDNQRRRHGEFWHHWLEGLNEVGSCNFLLKTNSTQMLVFLWVSKENRKVLRY